MAATKKMVLLLAAAVVLLAGSASATCWCSDVLTDYVGSKACWDTKCGSKEYSLPCWTFTPKKGFYGTPTSCVTYSRTSKTSLATIAAGCKTADGCIGFSIADGGSYKLKVCNYKTGATKVYSNQYDTRCMGVWEPDTTDPKCNPQPPSTSCVKPDCTCEKAYDAGSGAYYKCLECQQKFYGYPDKQKLCCSCPRTYTVDPINCIDCITTAKDSDKEKCPCCLQYYGDKEYENGGSLMRCYDCIRSHTTTDAAAQLMKYASVADQCLNFCRLTEPKKFPGMVIATECLDCTAHEDASKFAVTSNNPNGNC